MIFRTNIIYESNFPFRLPIKIYVESDEVELFSIIEYPRPFIYNKGMILNTCIQMAYLSKKYFIAFFLQHNKIKHRV